MRSVHYFYTVLNKKTKIWNKIQKYHWQGAEPGVY